MLRTGARRRHLPLSGGVKTQRDEIWEQRACLDGATTWLGIKLVITSVAARTAWEGGLISADRTSHAGDCGPKTGQAELYRRFLDGTGNHASPPGTSSHEGINGGEGGAPVTSELPVGAQLPNFMWGFDVGGDGDGFLAGARELGFDVRQHPDEPWHFNIASDPTPVLERLGVI